MTREELEEYNAMVAILNQYQEMFESLDEYRKLKREKKQGAEFKLYATHTHEHKGRKMHEALIEKIEAKTKNQNKAA